MGSTTRRIALLALLCPAHFGCGRASPVQPDSVVSLTIASARYVMAGRPGLGPSLQWIQVLTATGLSGATVRASRTELRSGSLRIVTESLPAAGSFIRPGVPYETPVLVTGLDRLEPADPWEGRAAVDVLHPSGRVERLEAAFSFDDH